MANEQVGVATAVSGNDMGPIPSPMGNPVPQQPTPPPPAPPMSTGNFSPAGSPTPPPPSENKGGMLFTVVVVIAIVSILALLGAFGYYLYTLQQTKESSQVPAQTAAVPSPTPAQTAQAISDSDNPATIEQELTQTTLEDFQQDFAALQAETAGL